MNEQPHRLTVQQTERLHHVLNENYVVSGGFAFPSLVIRPSELIRAINSRLAGLYKDVRLNGSSVALVVLEDASREELHISDLDVLYNIASFPMEDAHATFDRILEAVMGALTLWFPEELQESAASIPTATLASVYVSKLVKVPNYSGGKGGDCWSLICLRSDMGPSLEFKFVQSMRRKCEFTIDSIQVMLDDNFLDYACHPAAPDEPTHEAAAVCVHGDYEEALGHLMTRTIYIKNPEEVRGGGLLKYARLLTKGFKLPANMSPEDAFKLERTMSTRFFIDFPTVEAQHTQIVRYWGTHNFGGIHGVMAFLHKIYAVVKATTRANPSERASTLEMLDFVIRSMGYSAQFLHHHVSYPPIPPRQVPFDGPMFPPEMPHHQAVRDASPERTVPLLDSPPTLPFTSVPLIRTASLPPPHMPAHMGFPVAHPHHPLMPYMMHGPHGYGVPQRHSTRSGLAPPSHSRSMPCIGEPLLLATHVPRIVTEHIPEERPLAVDSHDVVAETSPDHAALVPARKGGLYPDTPPGTPQSFQGGNAARSEADSSDSEAISSDVDAVEPEAHADPQDPFRGPASRPPSRGRTLHPGSGPNSRASGRSLSPAQEMLFKKARKILASGDKPDVLVAKILRNPVCNVNEFGFQGNALSEGQTLLMVACKYGRVQCVKVLIDDFGADVNAIGGLGRYTPLCYAAYHGHEDVVVALLERGANCASRTAEGDTAESAARQIGHMAIANLIRDWTLNTHTPPHQCKQAKAPHGPLSCGASSTCPKHRPQSHAQSRSVSPFRRNQSPAPASINQPIRHTAYPNIAGHAANNMHSYARVMMSNGQKGGKLPPTQSDFMQSSASNSGQSSTQAVHSAKASGRSPSERLAPQQSCGRRSTPLKTDKSPHGSSSKLVAH